MLRCHVITNDYASRPIFQVYRDKKTGQSIRLDDVDVELSIDGSSTVCITCSPEQAGNRPNEIDRLKRLASFISWRGGLISWDDKPVYALSEMSNQYCKDYWLASYELDHKDAAKRLTSSKGK